MALPNNTIRKLLREQFPGDAPIRLAMDALDEWDEKIRGHVDALRDVEYTSRRTTYIENSDKRAIGHIRIQDPGKTSYYYATDFYIQRDGSGQLIIEGGDKNQPAYISDLAELTDLIALCQERLDRREAQQNRRKRMRDLKIQAIVAQVKKIAKAEQFDFYYDHDDIKLRLSVCLSETESVEFQIPFKQYQAVVPNIAEAVQSVRKLKELDMQFKMTRNGGWRRYLSMKDTMVRYKDL